MISAEETSHLMSLKFIRERRAGEKSANWETKRSTAVKVPV